jgi:hypothetical protein
LSEYEWRYIGIQMSKGWIHYSNHTPEPQILLFRRTYSGDGETPRVQFVKNSEKEKKVLKEKNEEDIQEEEIVEKEEKKIEEEKKVEKKEKKKFPPPKPTF